MDLSSLQNFLLWCLLINLGIYIFSAVCVMAMRRFMAGLHSKLFGISDDTASMVIYQYLGAYKLLLIVFNLVPWIAVQLIGP